MRKYYCSECKFEAQFPYECARHEQVTKHKKFTIMDFTGEE